MEITVSGRHLEITPAIRQYATDKVAKLPRYFDRVQSIRVIASKEDRSFTVEIIVDVERHDDFLASSTGLDIYACIDESIDKLERQLTDFKNRIRNRKHNTPQTEK